MKNIFPKPVSPPKPVKAFGPWLGIVCASISAGMALVHLFRIDTLLPIVDKVTPGNATEASFVVVFVVMAEVFALPFLLRMKLSPLAHVVSGLLAVFGPLVWLLISIWSFGTGFSTGQMGEFINVTSTPILVIVNSLWVTFAFLTLWALGYNRLKAKDFLGKLAS